MLYSWIVYFHNSWLRMDTSVETQNMLEKKILAEAELFPDATTIHGLSTIAAGEELWPIFSNNDQFGDRLMHQSDQKQSSHD